LTLIAAAGIPLLALKKGPKMQVDQCHQDVFWR